MSQGVLEGQERRAKGGGESKVGIRERGFVIFSYLNCFRNLMSLDILLNDKNT